MTDLVRPAHYWAPPSAAFTYGDRAAELAERTGRTPDLEQRLAVDAFCAVDSADRWVAFESVIIEGRQNGKTEGVLLPVVLDDLFHGPPDRVVWTAHRFRIARAAFREIKSAIDATPELSAKVKRISEANGEEAIELHSGALLEFLARSKGVGRGLGGKLVVLDEALYLDATSMGALLPTLSARSNTRVVYASSAGVGESDHLRSVRDRGRAGGDPQLAYLEWCAPEGGCRFGDECPHLVGTPGCKLDDESLWPAANPAMARGRITVEHVRNERRALPPDEFKRERLGWWDAPASGERPINADLWGSLAKPRRRAPADAQLAFFVHVAPDSTMAAVAVAYAVRGRPYVSLADYRPGSAWLAKRCGQLARKHPDATWGVDASGVAGAELPALEGEEIAPELFATRDMGQACAHLQQLVGDRGFAHSGDAAFAVAVAGAVRRSAGDGLWLFSAAKSSVDVSPLQAAAGALWLLEAYAPAEDFAVVV